MKHIRTINGIITELQNIDSKCAVTKHCLRALILSGEIPSSRAGAKYLIALEDVVDYFDSMKKGGEKL